ncbi:MAG: hypothetical protein NXI04_11910 [Planctomycetaceae bacterium]|nr:hypothetical protein [Planctomycetaceae bacterium]
MCKPVRFSPPLLRPAVVLCLALFSVGCMNPYYGYQRPYGNPYGQYAPPPSLNSNPGSLYIPESNAPPYEPSTFEDRNDDFDASDSDGQFYEGGVPQPQDYKDRDLGVSVDPYDGGIRQVSGQHAAANPSDAEYGFDFQDYSFLKGVLRYNGTGDGWAVTYSPAARDQFAGTLTLDMTSAQAQGLVEGDFVEVRGRVDTTVQDQAGAPIYRVESIQIVD